MQGHPVDVWMGCECCGIERHCGMIALGRAMGVLRRFMGASAWVDEGGSRTVFHLRLPRRLLRQPADQDRDARRRHGVGHLAHRARAEPPRQLDGQAVMGAHETPPSSERRRAAERLTISEIVPPWTMHNTPSAARGTWDMAAGASDGLTPRARPSMHRQPSPVEVPRAERRRAVDRRASKPSVLLRRAASTLDTDKVKGPAESGRSPTSIDDWSSRRVRSGLIASAEGAGQGVGVSRRDRRGRLGRHSRRARAAAAYLLGRALPAQLLQSLQQLDVFATAAEPPETSGANDRGMKTQSPAIPPRVRPARSYDQLVGLSGGFERGQPARLRGRAHGAQPNARPRAHRAYEVGRNSGSGAATAAVRRSAQVAIVSQRG